MQLAWLHGRQCYPLYFGGRALPVVAVIQCGATAAHDVTSVKAFINSLLGGTRYYSVCVWISTPYYEIAVYKREK